MTDQAGKLRALVERKIQSDNENTSNSTNNRPRYICVTSGKGGVGKTNFSINLGIAMSRRGMRTLIIDADLGLANVDVVLGSVTKYTFMNLLDADLAVKDILGEGPEGLKIISGGSGLLNVLELSEENLNRIIVRFKELNNLFDIIIIDTGAGLTKNILTFISASDETILVTTPEPTSLTDAYAMIKAISKDSISKKVSVVVNRAENYDEASQNFNKLLNASIKFLNFQITLLGVIIDDQKVKKSVQEQKPFLILYPKAVASQGVELIARKLAIQNSEDQIQKEENSFLERFLSIFNRR
ncbi:MinD/ParA family protein [Tindallia californiensis]|uniref:Flagellar biosynthesis protein FlhG n=1 Tax=Tindallia californiensis TaxID=159292 RepID=A0A1H3NRD5_9FIRM|nr:MinD/ParA family protein [Tindallia californiensis]SDY91240.1 flagellar biosynthesis protein FlhG [Tindallia californiensis]